MSKKGTKALASATLMSLVLTTALSAGPVKAAAGQAERIGAADRYATAAQVATKNWTTSDNVVLVSGEGYADAVSASALAKKLNAPILLTTAKTLSTDTASALSKLGAKNVYVVGGEASVSTAVRNELKKTYSLVELGGANRYETNVAVAQKLVDLGVDPSSVIMVGGEGFSDALSVAPVAAAKGQILLLGMNNADYMKPVLDFVSKNKSKVTVVGTKNVISEDILKTVGGTRVDGGKDRWDTNQKVLSNFKDTVKFDKLYVASAAYNAQDNGYADALVASALAGKYAAPLVLVDKDGNEGTNNALAYIKNNANKSTDLQVVGGTGVVSDALLGQITNAVNPTPSTGDTTVKSIESNGLNQVKVIFNTDVDSDSAESVANYKIDGSTLSDVKTDSNYATATLGSDNRTLTITLKETKEQHKEYTVAVKNSVLTADKAKTVSAFEQKVEFADVTAPTINSISIKGNSKITVNFTEPVKMPVTSDANGYHPTNTFMSKFKINGSPISSYGVDPQYTVVKHAVETTGSAVYADRVDFYFSSKLPSGNNTLKISDGDFNAGILIDAAGFVYKEASQDFTVDSVTTAPVVKEVKADSDGTLRVKFDRPMDVKTAVVKGNYGLNGDGNVIANAGVGELEDGDCTIKFKDQSFNTGSNTLYIKNNVKDAFGNKVEDDNRVNFTVAKDETKPTVTDVNMIDSETIRVRFSKDMDKNAATKISNYTLKDASGVDITDHIKVIKPAKASISDSTTAGSIILSNIENDSVWDIKIYKTKPGTSTDWRLTGAKYTLTLKSALTDTVTPNHNYLDEYTTTLNGTDSVPPKMTGAYKKDAHKLVVFFSEAMDANTLTNLSNYKYMNDSNDSKDMPSATKLTVSNDNKSVTIEFPSNYYMLSQSGVDGDNIVKGILSASLKDEAGNVIDSFNNSQALQATAPAVGYKDKTYRMAYEGDDLLVKFQYDGTVDPDTLTPDKFQIAGEQPDSASIIGSDIVLRFNNNSPSATHVKASYTAVNPTAKAASDYLDKIDVIKLAGPTATLKVQASPNDGSVLKDIAGATVASGTLINGTTTKVYDFTVAPKTTSDYWYATTDAGITLRGGDGTGNAAAVVLSFDTVINTNSGVKPDDFTFTIGGTEIKADEVRYAGNNLVFLFGNGKQTNFTAGTTKVGVALKNTSIDVETNKDDNGNYAKFVPSNDDKNKTRQIDTFSTVNFTGLTN